MKKFKYKSDIASFDIEYPYELKENDFLKYKDTLIKIFNHYGEKGWEIHSYKFYKFSFYDENDIQKYKSLCGNHNKPFTKFYLYLILKQEETINEEINFQKA